MFANWKWDAQATPSARTFASKCYRPRNGTELCSSLAARGIRRVLFYGDSTMSNLFTSSVYDLIPHAGPRDDTPGQLEVRGLAPSRDSNPGDCVRCHHCIGRLVHGMVPVPRGQSPNLYPERGLVESPCAHARRCDGAVELEIWRGAVIEWDVIRHLNESLAALVARGRAPDAVVFSVGTHYMSNRSALMGYSSDLDRTTRLFLDLPGLRAAVFVAQLGSTDRKPLQHRLMQASCEIGKLNAQAFALMSARGVAVVDSLALSHRIPDDHCQDGTHWDAWTLAAQGSLAFQALLSPEQSGAPWEAARNDMRACTLAIHRVTMKQKKCPTSTPSEREAQMLKQLRNFCSKQQRAFGQALPACVFDPREFFGNTAVTVWHSCVGCAEHCGESGRDCGRATRFTSIEGGRSHASFYCPAWYGYPECAT